MAAPILSRLNAAELARIARFGLTGVLSSLLYLAVFYGLQLLMAPVPASVLAYVLATTLNYLMQSLFTFGRAPVGGATLLKFIATQIICMATNTGLLWLLTEQAGLPPLETQSVLIFAIAGLSYLLSRWWVFGPGIAAREATAATAHQLPDSAGERVT